ncbi:MAG: glycosyltransferase family 39 protein [Pseudomonadota bacterium]
MKIPTRKIYEGRTYPLILCLVHLSILGIGVYMVDYFSKEEISGILMRWVPWNLRINFLLILMGTVICFHDIIGTFKGFVDRRGMLLAGLVILAFLTTCYITPRTHRIFFDEDIYGNIAQNIALADQAGYCNYGTFEYDEYTPHWITYNKQPSGWPLLISLAFQLFGSNEVNAFFLNNVLFSLSTVLVFFITWHLTGAYFTSFVSALAFAFMPHNLMWSNTAAAEPSAGFFAGVAVLSLIIFLKTGKDRHLFLLAVLIPFACQIRTESLLTFLWVIIAILTLSPRITISKGVWTCGFLITIFLLPHLLHIYSMGGESWGAEGDKFSPAFFWNNLHANGTYYLNNKQFPMLLTVLAIVGFLFSRHSMRWKGLILAWFLLFWGVFLFFYAGSYKYGADVRFALTSFMPLAILAGMGAGCIRDWIQDAISRTKDAGAKIPSAISSFRFPVSSLLILLILFSFMQFLPLIRQEGQEAWGARYDHKHAREFIKKIPRRSIVLTHIPTMFLLWKQSAIQTYAGINHPDLIEYLVKKYDGHVYFHYNYWCNTKTDRNTRLCQAIKERYMLKEIARAHEQDNEYALYQMGLK